MVVGLVSHGDALLLKLTPALAVDVQAHVGGVLGGGVAEDVRHVVKHPQGRQTDRRSAYIIQVVQEEFSF